MKSQVQIQLGHLFFVSQLNEWIWTRSAKVANIFISRDSNLCREYENIFQEAKSFGPNQIFK